MLREDGGREMLARLQRGERIKAIARELGGARNTVKRWQQLGAGGLAHRDTAPVVGHDRRYHWQVS